MNAKWSLFTAVLIACLAIAGFALAASRTGGFKDETTVSAPELPREWVWKKQTVNFDDMYAPKPHAL